MYCLIIPALQSTVAHERREQISLNYNLVEEDRSVLPNSTSIIDFPPSGMIGFYIYYFKVALHVPASPFFGFIVEAYKIHTFELKPNSISKIVCFEILCYVILVVPTVALFQYLF